MNTMEVDALNAQDLTPKCIVLTEIIESCKILTRSAGLTLDVQMQARPDSLQDRYAASPVYMGLLETDPGKARLTMAK